MSRSHGEKAVLEKTPPQELFTMLATYGEMAFARNAGASDTPAANRSAAAVKVCHIVDALLTLFPGNRVGVGQALSDAITKIRLSTPEDCHAILIDNVHNLGGNSPVQMVPRPGGAAGLGFGFGAPLYSDDDSVGTVTVVGDIDPRTVGKVLN